MSPLEAAVDRFIETFQQYQLSKRGGVFVPFPIWVETDAVPPPGPKLMPPLDAELAAEFQAVAQVR